MLVERLIKSGACPRRVMFIPDGLFWGCQPASWTPSSRSLCRRTSWHPTHPWSWESPWSTCPDKTPTQALDMSEDTRHTALIYCRTGGMCVCVCAHLPLDESLSHPEAHAFEDGDTDSSVLERRRTEMDWLSGRGHFYVCGSMTRPAKRSRWCYYFWSLWKGDIGLLLCGKLTDSCLRWTHLVVHLAFAGLLLLVHMWHDLHVEKVKQGLVGHSWQQNQRGYTGQCNAFYLYNIIYDNSPNLAGCVLNR